MKTPRKLVLMSMFVAMALVLHLFEGMLPIQFGTPGAKLGLANIVTVVSLYLFGFKESFTIVTVRILLGSLFAGGVTGFLYSLSGGLVSLFVMVLLILLFKDNVSIIGVSIAGAVTHGVGQILMAMVVVQNVRIISYLPVLMILSIGTGVFVGIVSKMMLRLIPNHIEALSNYRE